METSEGFLAGIKRPELAGTDGDIEDFVSVEHADTVLVTDPGTGADR